MVDWTYGHFGTTPSTTTIQRRGTGNHKPTQLLRSVQQLLGDKASTMGSSFVCTLFIQRLTANVRMVLASTPDTANLKALSQLADKIAEVATPSIAVVSTSQYTDELEQLLVEVASLKGIITSFPQSTVARRDHSRGPSRNRSRGRSASPHPSTEPSVCWYNKQFGERAQKCTQPCSFSGNDQASH